MQCHRLMAGLISYLCSDRHFFHSQFPIQQDPGSVSYTLTSLGQTSLPLSASFSASSASLASQLLSFPSISLKNFHVKANAERKIKTAILTYIKLPKGNYHFSQHNPADFLTQVKKICQINDKTVFNCFSVVPLKGSLLKMISE